MGTVNLYPIVNRPRRLGFTGHNALLKQYVTIFSALSYTLGKTNVIAVVQNEAVGTLISTRANSFL